MDSFSGVWFCGGVLRKFSPVLPAALLVILFAGYFAFRNLGAHSISQRSDEVIYARVVQSITLDHKVLFPTHGDIPFFNKPPMKFWIDAAAISVVGETNFGFRAVSAVCGVLLVALTMFAGWKLFRSPSAGVFAGLLLLAFPELTISPHGMRRSVLDPFLSVLCGLALLFGYRALVSNRKAAQSWIMFGVLSAAAILTKSVAGFFPWAVLGAFAITSKETRAAAWAQRAWISAALALTVVLPAIYYAALFIRSPKAIEIVLGWEIVHRATLGFTGHATGEPLYYLIYVARGKLGPPLLLALGTLLALIGFRKHQDRLVLCWAAVPLILYSAAESKVPWYLMPAFPACALLCALAAVRTAELITARFGAGKRKVILDIFFLALLAVCAPIVGVLTRCVRMIETQVERLPLDLLTEEIESNRDAKIYLVGKPLTRRANPVRGRFNVEGVYFSKFWPRSVKVNSWAELPQNLPAGSYIFVKSADAQAPSPRLALYRELPGVPPRDEPVTVYRAVEPAA